MPTLRYWAGARTAAGVESEHLAGETVEAVLAAAVAAHPPLATVVPHCAILVEGRRTDGSQLVGEDAVVEVLPPFAGG